MRTRRLTSSSDPVPSKHRPQLHNKDVTGHRPVLLHEAIEYLVIEPTDTVVDATLGGAGHAKKIAERLGEHGVIVGLDADRSAIERARALEIFHKPNSYLIEANFRNLDTELEKIGITRIEKALFDLGWSSDQLVSGRGFSFLKDEPLLMTYALTPERGALTASRIVNEWEEENIAVILRGWGEEKYSRRIARKIVEARERSAIRTSRQLADIVAAAVPATYRRARIHPATRTFQALRIAVNDEIGALAKGLCAAWELLAPGGRIAVITFHSVEDRAVKRLFAGWEREKKGVRVLKKPVSPQAEEIARNPRSRSAKLRIIEKK